MSQLRTCPQRPRAENSRNKCPGARDSFVVAVKTEMTRNYMHENTKSEYMLLFRGTQWDRDMSPEQMQRAAGHFMAWFESLKATGKATAGQPLQREGRVITKNGRTISDGPYAESKEAIGGYFLLNVTSMEEAVQIAKGCPGLDVGITVEVRPVAERCPMMEHAEQNLAEAVA
jgi:hypothetical protein